MEAKAQFRSTTSVAGSAVLRPSSMVSGEGGSTTSKCSHGLDPRARPPLGGGRKNERELAPRARLGLHGDVAAVARRDLLAQKQPESGAIDGHVLFGRQPAESGEKPRHVLGGDAETLVTNAYRDL